jgi:hypothetical protein
MMAVGAVLALQEAGVRCPEDIAVVGFDDVPIAELVRPALTTLRIDIAGLGKHAVERLVGLIQSPDGCSGRPANRQRNPPPDPRRARIHDGRCFGSFIPGGGKTHRAGRNSFGGDSGCLG